MTREIFVNQEEEIKYYSNRKFVNFVRIDKNGTYIFADCRCRRCGGSGILPEYSHVDGGVCYQCNGAGYTTGSDEIKIYTEEYGAKLQAKRKEKAEQKRQQLLAESEGRRQEWLKKEGFNAEGKTWLVLGKTYEVKEQLKELGAKFDYSLGWHVDHELEGFDTIVLDAKVVTYIDYKGDLDYCRCYVPEGENYEAGYSIAQYIKELKQEAENELKTARKIANGEHISEYIGTVGERREFTCKLVGHFCYESNFGRYGYWTDNTMHIYKFKDENGDIVVWNTATYLDDDKPEYKFKATIKEHSEYKGEKQTVISRPKFFTEN